MDSKISRAARHPLIFIAISLLLFGCKQHNWMDWKTQNEVWLAQNIASDSTVKVTKSGLQYKIIADPTPLDAKPSSASNVTCDYTLKLINGNVLESGHYTFALSSVISGFAEGCCLVHNNGDIRLFIPYYLGYDKTKVDEDDEYNAVGNEGTEGTHSYIPPYSTLIYDIHICSVSGN